MKDKNCLGKHRQKGTLMSKNHIVSLTIVLCLFALLFATPVKGQNTPSIVIEESEPMLALAVYEENSSNQSSATSASSQPYIAGYMTTDYLWGNPGREPGGATALRVTVSFSGTDKSVIQSDNFLTAGITAQGPDRYYGDCAAIDWGYIFNLVLGWGVSEPFIHAEVVEVHEWGDDCIPPAWSKVVSSWNAFIDGLSIDSPVTLTMEWTEDTLDYYAEVGGTNYLLNSYTPNATSSHYFMLGTVDREPWPIVSGTVKWFQFHGAWSNYNIGQVGWHSRLSNPQFIKTGESSWKDVSFAYSTDGRYAYLDHTVRWGGDRYENVYASYSSKNVHFYPTSDGTTLAPDTLLWAPPPPPGGGGCSECRLMPYSPTLFVWNGSQHVKEATFDLHGDSDVTVWHTIEQLLVPEDDHYLLSLRELNESISYIDYVKLYTVDTEGEMYENHLTHAMHSELGNVKQLLKFDDDKRVDLGPSQIIDLKFNTPEIENTAHFIFMIQGYSPS